MYIYAFPVQGLVVWLIGPTDPWRNIALALPLTLACAVASWHWVEEPGLALLKRRRARPAVARG
jgi:peptidoglycan/LPS O-acetylase OafA/YrhL